VKYGVGIATVLTLAVTTTMAVAIVGISGINPRQALESGVLDPSTLRLENPFGKHAEEAPAEEDVPGESLPGESLSLRRFATVVYILAVPGWLFEALLTSLMIGFIAKVRPDLLGLGPPHVPLGEPVTDYGRH
jgi:ABC-type Co2+ transport system permease subunit